MNWHTLLVIATLVGFVVFVFWLGSDASWIDWEDEA